MIKCRRCPGRMIDSRYAGEDKVCLSCGATTPLPVGNAAAEYGLSRAAAIEGGMQAILSENGIISGAVGRSGRKRRQDYISKLA